MHSYVHLIVEPRGEVLWVRINRPKSRNALSRATLAEIGELFRSMAADRSLKCAVVTGAGDQAFAAGGDLKEFSRLRSAADAAALFDLASESLDQIRNFPVPVVAAINGWALGGGAELALACDFRVGAANASIGFIQSRLNVTPAFGGGDDLIRVLGSSRALLHAWSGDALNAEQALALGLLDAVAGDTESLDTAVAKFIAPILRQQSQVVRGYKAIAVAHRQNLPLQTRRAVERHAFVETWTHDDHWSAVDAKWNPQE